MLRSFLTGIGARLGDWFRFRRANSLVDQEVVAVVPKATVYITDDVSNVIGPAQGKVFKVVEERGDWLWVSAPGNEGWVKRAEVALVDDALERFSSGTSQGAEAAFVLNQLAVVMNHLVKSGRAATTEARAALEDNPGLPEAQDLVAELNALQAELKQTELSAAALQLVSSGLTLRGQRALDGALDAFNQALDMDPQDVVALNGRSLVWKDKKQFDRALEDLNKAIALAPDDAELLMNRGNIWKEMKELDKALRDFDDAIRREPKDPRLYNNRSLVWKLKGDYGRALEDIRQALRIKADYANGYNNLAWLLATCPDERYRNGAQAVEAASRACALVESPKAGLMDTLAAAHAEAGNFAEAVTWQRQAIEAFAADGPEAVAKARDRLVLYEAHQPFRADH